MRPLHPLLAHPSLRDALLKTAAMGLVCAAAGLFVSPERFWANALLAGLLALTLSLGAAVFLATQAVTGASWSCGLERIAGPIASALWVGLSLTAAAVLLGHSSLYGWVHEAGAHSAHSQEIWLARPFQAGRLAVYAAVWLTLCAGLIRRIGGGEKGHSEGARGFAAVFLAVFALTFSAAGMDWVMTLEPHWYSTIFSVYLFAGAFVGGLASIAVALSVARHQEGVRSLVSESLYHDLGKLLFGFSCFWAYILFCQFLLIWYTNIPEETGFFLKRMRGPWGVLMALSVAVNWVVPFFVLMAGAVKKNPKALFRVGVCLLFGRWLDLYIVVMPRFLPQGPALAPWELGFLAGALALFAWAVAGAWESGRARRGSAA
ncbi:MAG: hypothetical protein AAB576_10315 [Elusimicrobiota bacterium]